MHTASPRILILTSSTGGGHNARAYALQSWIRELNPQTPILIHKTLEQTHPVYAFGVALYNQIQRHAPILHHLYFHFLEFAKLHKNAARIIGKKHFTSIVESFRPEIIFSVHAHTNHGYFDLARSSKLSKKPLCITYCGELTGGYGFSHLWVNPHADYFIGSTQETCATALRLAMPQDKIIHGGFLLDPRFSKKPDCDRASILHKLNLNPKSFTLLIPASGSGAEHHKKILRALQKTALPLQAIFLCGKNQRLIQHLHQSSTQALRIAALPHSTEMPTLLRAIDLIITRPGSGTTSEAILSGCPILHHTFGGIMPQENLTLRYCQEHHLSVYADTYSKLTALVQSLFHQRDTLANMRAAQKERTVCDVPKLITFLLDRSSNKLPTH